VCHIPHDQGVVQGLAYNFEQLICLAVGWWLRKSKTRPVIVFLPNKDFPVNSSAISTIDDVLPWASLGHPPLCWDTSPVFPRPCAGRLFISGSTHGAHGGELILENPSMPDLYSTLLWNSLFLFFCFKCQFFPAHNEIVPNFHSPFHLKLVITASCFGGFILVRPTFSWDCKTKLGGCYLFLKQSAKTKWIFQF